MRSGEDANQFSLNVQRNRYLGLRGFVASDVVRVLAHIWGVAHLSGASRVADHAVFAQLQDVAFAANLAASTAMRASQH